MGKMLRKETNKIEQNERVLALRNQYEMFLNEDRRRKERNSQILRCLDDIRNKTGALQARTDSVRMLEWTDDMSRAPQPIDVSSSPSFHLVSSNILHKRPWYLNPKHNYIDHISPDDSPLQIIHETLPVQTIRNDKKYLSQTSEIPIKPTSIENEIQKSISNVTVDDIIREIGQKYILVRRPSIDHLQREEANEKPGKHDFEATNTDRSASPNNSHSHSNYYPISVFNKVKGALFESDSQSTVDESHLKTQLSSQNNHTQDKLYHDIGQSDQFNTRNTLLPKNDQKNNISTTDKTENKVLSAENKFSIRTHDLNTKIPDKNTCNNKLFKNDKVIPQEQDSNLEHSTKHIIHLDSIDIKINEHLHKEENQDVSNCDNQIEDSENLQGIISQNVVKHTKRAETQSIKSPNREIIEINSQKNIDNKNVYQDSQIYLATDADQEHLQMTQEETHPVDEQSYDERGQQNYKQFEEGRIQDSYHQNPDDENQQYDEKSGKEAYPDSRSYLQTAKYAQEFYEDQHVFEQDTLGHYQNVDANYEQNVEELNDQNVDAHHGQNIDLTHNENVVPTRDQNVNSTAGTAYKQYTTVANDVNVEAPDVSNQAYEQTIITTYDTNTNAEYDENVDIVYDQNIDSTYDENNHCVYEQNIDSVDDNATYDENVDATYQNVEATYDGRVVSPYDKKFDAGYVPNAEPGFIQNSDAPYDQCFAALYDQSVDSTQNVGFNKNIFFNADDYRNYKVAYDPISDSACDENANANYDRTAGEANHSADGVTINQSFSASDDQNMDPVHAQNTDEPLDESATYNENVKNTTEQTMLEAEFKGEVQVEL